MHFDLIYEVWQWLSLFHLNMVSLLIMIIMIMANNLVCEFSTKNCTDKVYSLEYEKIKVKIRYFCIYCIMNRHLNDFDYDHLKHHSKELVFKLRSNNKK